MQYSVTETDDAISDVINFAKYIKYHLGNLLVYHIHLIQI